MRILIAPDKFAGTLTAEQAAEAIGQGWRRSRPGDEIHTMPLADGGPGFLAALHASLTNSHLRTLTVLDPLGRQVEAAYLRHGEAAYIEAAAGVGLHLLTEAERDPRRATSFGLGQLIAAAIDHGARQLIIGLGGTAVCDGGAGMLTALGLTLRDAADHVVPYGAAHLINAASLDGFALLRGVEIVAATDVDSPLLGPSGATYMFAPQKGADAADLPLFEAGLARLASLLQELPTAPSGLLGCPGGGAAGGIGAALLALGARRESGAQIVSGTLGLRSAIEQADLVITGEGSFDSQSLRGKVPAEVAAEARRSGRRCVVLAGRIGTEAEDPTGAQGTRCPESRWREAGVSAVWSLTEHLGSSEAAWHNAQTGLVELAQHVASDIA
ncbi:glycerate kinase [Natronoglycomyces albus]|uniref:Glycerate kinase n=1 Tax=Natronoglycomyces albus TaxID=2811108 RepID=A0A895XT30_9ACTN|nr:glycerate kinase [Natronoglycomyces albus]QSB06425.1 glycerate kinase [Natronoglycomyces albus]